LDQRGRHHFGTAHAIRINLLLAEGQDRRALDLAMDATQTLPLDSWHRLLPAAETLDPTTALHICRTLIDGHVRRTSNQGYQTAVALLPILQRLHRDQNDLAAFDVYLDRLRQGYRAKRNFIALLDEQFPANRPPSSA
ncbi:hypothetical protein BRN37_24135, partial [Xanthomonas oryzae pv. oryzae]